MSNWLKLSAVALLAATPGLAADPLGPDACRLRTETRVATTDPRARRMFRRYWAAFSAGIHLIRPLLLGTARREAERRARANRTA